MLAYRDLTKEQLEEELLKQKEAYKEICAKNISLDMSRGKPGQWICLMYLTASQN